MDSIDISLTVKSRNHSKAPTDVRGSTHSTPAPSRLAGSKANTFNAAHYISQTGGATMDQESQGIMRRKIVNQHLERTLKVPKQHDSPLKQNLKTESTH
jgi:hypothetical protein